MFDAGKWEGEQQMKISGPGTADSQVQRGWLYGPRKGLRHEQVKKECKCFKNEVKAIEVIHLLYSLPNPTPLGTAFSLT